MNVAGGTTLVSILGGYVCAKIAAARTWGPAGAGPGEYS